jgi:Fe-S cluster assembly scaffold protein SufB
MDNYTLHIPAYTQAQTPIIVPEQAASITIIVGQHASSILHHVQKVSTEITITLEPYAHLQFVQSLAQEYNHQTKVICYQKENSSVIFNGRYCYSIQAMLNFFLLGQQANTNISCIIEGQDSTQSNFNTLQMHQAADTTSAVLLKGLLQDHARSMHTGMIHIDLNAPNSNATLQSRYLLMGNDAQAYAQPQLEVLNHDVACFHGSAIGSCNDDDLFYLASRGLDTKNAQQLICDAFLK